MQPTRWLVCLAAALALTACGDEEPPTRDDLFKARLELPAVYITVNSAKRVIAPSGKGAFTDPATGEKCFPAQACYAPDCVGRSQDGEPFLFITPGYEDPKAEHHSNGVCPKCWKTFELHRANAQTVNRYASYVRTYVLPETAEQLKKLAEQRRQQPPSR